MKLINDFYKGYEGENEIRFIKECENDVEVLSIWDGYFNDIMEQFKPTEKGWEGLAYYYHLHIGWYENSPWEILDLESVLQQFRSVEQTILRFEKSSEVLSAICRFILDAIMENARLYISEE
ncbi:hypothetical protein [Clostridium sp. KNHs205]|jgi:hypothetical protein|uniref:hypothetical protein n=1 Tax=Clostridium sp. KNHs205 TaxID=1449050 RepID=UPI00068FD974|nr:hypothetical protein [Clostridium sp. KNHs205]